MALINRITRLFQADMNAVLDRLEEPEMTLRQSIREMEEAQQQDELQLKLLAHEQQQLCKTQNRHSSAIEQLEDEIDICFQSNEENLVKNLIRKKLQTEQFKSQIEHQILTIEERMTELRSELSLQADQLESMHQKLDIFAKQYPEDITQFNDLSRSNSISDEEVEVALLKEKQRRAS